MLFNSYFHKTNSLEEAFGVLDQVSQMTSLKDFLSQQKSPYMLLQILAIALIALPEFPAISLEELNANPKLLIGDNVRKKMNFLMTKTRFSNDFNTIFRTVFPDATANPIEWSKKNREITTNLDNPEIKKVLSAAVQKYSGI